MAGPSAAAKNAMLNRLGSVAELASLHSADPGTTGASEALCDRKPITWSLASGGSMKSSNEPVFDVPPGTYAWFGLWSSAGTYYDGGPLSAAETFTGPGTYTLSSVTLEF
jgi:hypothetical protein